MAIAVVALLPYLTVGQTHEKTPETKPAYNIEGELERLDDEAEEAAGRGDASFFEKFLSDDYTGIGSTGPHEHQGSDGGVCPVGETQVRGLEN